jgi:chromate transporter
MVSYLDLFTTFFKIGAFTLGGGYSMIPVMKYEIVDKLKWLTNKEFINYISLDSIIPGSISVNLSTLIGKKLRGNGGVIVSIIGLLLPSLILIVLLYDFYTRYKKNKYAEGIIYGLKLGTIALIIVSLCSITENGSSLDLKDIIIISGLVYLITFMNINPFIAIIISGIMGIILKLI